MTTAKRWLVAMGACLLLISCGGGDGDGGPSGDTAMGGDTAVTADTSEPGGDDALTPEDATTPPDDTGEPSEPDTTAPVEGCEFSSDCDPPRTACRDGECVPGCPDNPCPEGWNCVPDTGVCIQHCIIHDDCEQEGYWCEGGRCVAGCTWHPCVGGADCDHESGICAPSFCQWEVEASSDVLYFGIANPEAPSGLVLSTRVWALRPDPANITLTLTEGSNPAFAITEPASFPQTVPPGQMLQATVVFQPESGQGAFGLIELSADGEICANNPVRLIAAGTTDCLSAQPEVLDLGKVAVGDVARGVVRLRNDCAEPVTVEQVAFLQAFGDWSVPVDPVGTQLAPAATLDIDVLFTPTMPFTRASKIFVVTDHPTNRVLQVPLEGAGAHEATQQ